VEIGTKPPATRRPGGHRKKENNAAGNNLPLCRLSVEDTSRNE